MGRDADLGLLVELPQGPVFGPAQAVEIAQIRKPDCQVGVLAFVPQRNPCPTVGGEAGNLLPGRRDRKARVRC